MLVREIFLVFGLCIFHVEFASTSTAQKPDREAAFRNAFQWTRSGSGTISDLLGHRKTVRKRAALPYPDPDPRAPRRYPPDLMPRSTPKPSPPQPPPTPKPPPPPPPPTPKPPPPPPPTTKPPTITVVSPPPAPPSDLPTITKVPSPPAPPSPKVELVAENLEKVYTGSPDDPENIKGPPQPPPKAAAAAAAPPGVVCPPDGIDDYGEPVAGCPTS